MTSKFKILLTEEQKTYLVKHFRNTKNAELARHIGLSERTMLRRARELGLKKTKQFMNKTAREGLAAANAVNEMTDYRNQRQKAKQMHQEWRENHGDEPYPGTFRNGVSPLQRLGKRKEKKRIDTMQKKRSEMIARDRRRIRIGLEPLTNYIKAYTSSQSKISFRYIMKKRYGYLPAFRVPELVYYTDETRRNQHIERVAREYGIHIQRIQNG